MSIDDVPSLRARVQVATAVARKLPKTGEVVNRHGLYSWGETLAQAKRHIEIFEFLLETIGRTMPFRSL